MTMDTAMFGQVAPGDTAVHQLTTLPHNTNGAVLKAMAGNTGKVYVGTDNTVSATTGYELSAGDELPLEMVNPSRLWIKLSVATDRLCWGTLSA